MKTNETLVYSTIRIYPHTTPILPEYASLQPLSLSEEALRNTSAITFDNTSSSMNYVNDSVSLNQINPILENVRKVHIIISCFLGAFFSLFAIFGNMIFLYGWIKSQKSSSTSRYMVAQAGFDVMVCILYFVRESLSFYYTDLTQEKSYGQFHSYFGSPIYSLLIFTSNWNLAATATDRYFKVCRPSFAKVSIFFT
jgi:hypothetical protein